MAEKSELRTVLLLLAIARGLLESLDEESSGGGDDLDLADTVLDSELAGNLLALPVLSALGNIVGHLLGRLKAV